MKADKGRPTEQEKAVRFAGKMLLNGCRVKLALDVGKIPREGRRECTANRRQPETLTDAPAQ